MKHTILSNRGIHWTIGIAALVAMLHACSEEEKLPLNTAPIPRIIELQPTNAAAGDRLSIIGVNFSENADENEVKFNQQVVDVVIVSDTLIQVIVPELSGNVVGVSVRSHGKISNKRNLSLVRVKTFTDDFNRTDIPVVGSETTPNPIGNNWQIVNGTFELKNGTLFSQAGGSESYMLYRDPDLVMNAGEGNYFKLSATMKSSPESFAGIIFNAQSDNKRFYLLRTTNNMLQLLKTGNDGLGHWVNIMINETFEGFAANTTYQAEVTSSQPGRITVKVSDTATGGILVERTVEDPEPYLGGSPGFYYFGLANPVDISFDNLSVEVL